jgi:hemoglobin-like flavoprotein
VLCAPAVLDTLIMARPLHENAPHCQGGRRKEMTAPLPLSGLARHAKVGLVDEGSRLQGLIRLSLASEPRPGELPQFVIHFWQQLARRGRSVGMTSAGCHGGSSMTPESIARLKNSFTEVAAEPHALAARFYLELFTAVPGLRPLFPTDMTVLQGHFEAALALVIRNLEDMAVLQDSLRDLGAQHVGWGVKPEDYFVVRDVIVRAIHEGSASWNEQLEADWRSAITAIVVAMLQGAAVHTAVVAEELADSV